ncbi:hypothetical protein [Mucilaginibacter lappiensis]|jgi:hypothetical protein|uniref:hypothetical protein n=1 Tax=Mucilaginibacter lappiensis TaxID=354630 RepID=UPI003D1C309C
MKCFTLIFAMITLCSVSSCNKDKMPTSTSIIGKWRWVKSVGGIAGSTVTPQSTGYNLSEEFKADSTFKRFKNDSLIAQGKFSIVRNYKYASTETIDVLKTGGPDDLAFVIRNDSLFVSDIFISDGFNTAYVRVK